MLSTADIKNFLRDLMYTEEDSYQLARDAELPPQIQKRILDNIKEKQVIIAKIVNLIIQETAQ